MVRYLTQQNDLEYQLSPTLEPFCSSSIHSNSVYTQLTLSSQQLYLSQLLETNLLSETIVFQA